MKLEKAKTWWYQLQGKILLDRSEDVIVMDIDQDPRPYLTKPDGTPRAVLAYLSIGEAEEYRGYWKQLHERVIKHPLILFENPDWPGNHAVQFWDGGWQGIVKAMARFAQKQGFTGLYLDKADVAWDIAQKDLGMNYEFLLGRMAAFVVSIAAEVPDMDIVLQNCEDLYDFPDVCRVLDATAHEDVLYGDPATGKRNPYQTIHERLAAIRTLSGIPRFAVEYIDDTRTRRQAIKDLEFHKFIALVRPQNRELA